MKRNWNMVRQLLRSVRDLSPGGTFYQNPPKDDGVDYHLRIMQQGGLIAGVITDRDFFEAHGITAHGQALLDTMGDDAKWERIKAEAADRSIGLTEDSIAAIGARV